MLDNSHIKKPFRENIGEFKYSSRKVQIREILNIALSLSTKNIRIIEKSPEKLRKTNEDIILGNNNKIKSELGWEITQSVEEILEEMYDFWID